MSEGKSFAVARGIKQLATAVGPPSSFLVQMATRGFGVPDSDPPDTLKPAPTGPDTIVHDCKK